MTSAPSSPLQPVLGTLRLWGIAVGLVISGGYFGSSDGRASAGTLGFTVMAIAVAVMCACFVCNVTVSTTSMPDAFSLAAVHGMFVAIPRAVCFSRRREPAMPRPSRVPACPVMPALATVGAVVCLPTLADDGALVSTVFVGLLALGCACFRVTRRPREAAVRLACIESRA